MTTKTAAAPKSAKVAKATPETNGQAAKLAATKAKPEAAPAATKKAGLPKAQIRILTALAKKGACNRQMLSEAANVPATHVVGFTRVKYASKKSPALMELGYVKGRVMTLDGGKKEWMYEITPAGKKALEKILKN